MHKNSRKYECGSAANAAANCAKRKCLLNRSAMRISSSSATITTTTKAPTPSSAILWSEKDESFFSELKLDTLLNLPESTTSQREKSTILDESKLFNDFSTDDPFRSPIRLTQGSSSLDGDETLFAAFDVNAEALSLPQNDDNGQVDLFGTQYCSTSNNAQEEVDLFADIECDEEAHGDFQNTQRFLKDVGTVSTISPNFNSICDQSIKHETKIEQLPTNASAWLPGSQYVTREEMCNRTLQAVASNSDEVPTLSQFLLAETQPFLLANEEIEHVPSLGDFYGLPDRVKRLILEHKGIDGLYEWQKECLNLPAIGQRKNLIYALPTSGGKTLVAEILMLRELLCRQKNVLFILPYVSIVQEKVSAMSPFAIAMDFIVDEYTSGKGRCPPVKRMKRKSLFIASIEKGAILMDSLIDAGRANEIGLVVIDELHLIGEKGRGATLEALLAKIMFLDAKIQIVGMSATIGNLAEVSAFLSADVYTRGFRPVELKEYIKCGDDILEIIPGKTTVEETFVFNRRVNFKYTAAVARCDPDHLGGLVSECAPENCCLIFCSTRKNCENVALLLSRILPKAKFLEHRKSEKADLMDALDKVCGILSPTLAKTIPFGIAYHHSGLTTDERKFIETAYRFGVLSVICCTSTLAAGVNLPAKRVIIRAPYVGAEFMTLCRYKQMVGRAGRAGMGQAGESILIAASRDNVRVAEMLFSPMDNAISSLNENDCIGLQSLILSAIGLQLANCRLDLMRLIDSTLLAVQAEQLSIDKSTVLVQILREMFSNKVLQVCAGQPGVETTTTQILPNGSTQIPATQNDTQTQSTRRRISIGRTTRFELTTIGKAAFKAGIDYKRAFTIHHEIQQARQQLILTNYAHLLYLVVCFNSNGQGNELFAGDAVILFRLYSTANEVTQKLFATLGVTEAHAAKIAKTHSLQGAMELKLNRLYKVLILTDVLDIVPMPVIAAKFNIERGMLQNLISQCTAAASALVRLCEQVDEFWCFKALFERICAKMDRCGTIELEPLLELPAVKLNRAKQLYAAGYRTIEDIAKCRPSDLMVLEHMPMRIAKEIISAAMIILMKKLDLLEGETAALKVCLQQGK